MTAVSLLGFSVAYNVLSKCLLAVPLGLVAGTIDAAINNYVAYYFGLTVGRLVSGVLTNRFSTWSIIRVGLITLLAETVVIFVFDRSEIVVIGLFMIGAGVAPIFPGLIFLTPRNFGVEISQSVTGLEMAFAYCGSLASPVLIGFMLKTVSKQCLPIVLLCFILLAMVCNFGLSYLLKRGSANQESDL